MNDYIESLGMYLPAVVGPVLSFFAIYKVRNKLKINKWAQVIFVLIASVILFTVTAKLRIMFSAWFTGEGDQYEMIAPELVAIVLFPFVLLLSLALIYRLNFQSLPDFLLWKKKWKWSLYSLLIGVFATPLVFQVLVQSFSSLTPLLP